MKFSGVDFNDVPATITCVISSKEKLLEFFKPAASSQKDVKRASCCLLVAPGDVLSITLTADPGTVDEYDLYIDGILRASQPNPNHQKKSKVTFKKVCYKGDAKKALKAYHMNIQRLTNKSAFIAENSTHITHVGSIVIKCWQKKSRQAQLGGEGSQPRLSPSIASAITHAEWFDLPENLVANDVDFPSLEVGFINGRASIKSKKSARGLVNQLEDAVNRNIEEYELFAEMEFVLRSAAELIALGFDNVPLPQLAASYTETGGGEELLQENNKSTMQIKGVKEIVDLSPVLLAGFLPLITSTRNDRDRVSEERTENEVEEEVEGDVSQILYENHSTLKNQSVTIKREELLSENRVSSLDKTLATNPVLKAPLLDEIQRPIKVWNKLASNLTLKGYPIGPAPKASLSKLPQTKTKIESNSPNIVITTTSPHLSSQDLQHEHLITSIEQENQLTAGSSSSIDVLPHIKTTPQATITATSGYDQANSGPFLNALNISLATSEPRIEVTLESSFDERTEVADDEDIIRSVESSRPIPLSSLHNLGTKVNIYNESQILSSPTPPSQINTHSPKLILQERSQVLGVNADNEVQRYDGIAHQLFNSPSSIASKRPAEEVISAKPEKHRRLGESNYSRSPSTGPILSQRPLEEIAGSSTTITPLPSLREINNLDLSKVLAEYDTQVKLNKLLKENIELYTKVHRIHQETKDLRCKNEELAAKLSELTAFTSQK